MYGNVLRSTPAPIVNAIGATNLRVFKRSPEAKCDARQCGARAL